ncbi:helix-turn-helix transcriptional regulator [Robertmurraya massiliosenegalensis]|uniref:helix-turn-helix transcriptional regulator n=1 Tax=Robertmurraya TaxID=2837507 RepID=UPI0039A4B0E6
MKNNIRDLRAIHNLTQDELAERLEVSRQTIISLEKERYNPSITLAFKLARVFNCQIEEIFTYEEE